MMKSEITTTTNFTHIIIDSQPIAVEGPSILSIGLHGNHSCFYFLEDHLGSTRMVLAQNGEIKEALVYQPYGAVSDVQGITPTGNDPLRQKFTTKEFDEDGPDFGQIKFDITFDFALTHTIPEKPNRVEVYYAGAPSNPEILYVTIDPDNHKGKLTATLNNATSRAISSIQFKLNDETVSCDVQNINEIINPGSKLTITKTASAITDFLATVPKTFLNYSNGDFYMAGIQAYHFGARTYDPDLGIWSSIDPSSQFKNPYLYCGFNPVSTVDPDGKRSWNFMRVVNLICDIATLGAHEVSKVQIYTAVVTTRLTTLPKTILKAKNWSEVEKEWNEAWELGNDYWYETTGNWDEEGNGEDDGLEDDSRGSNGPTFTEVKRR